MSPIDKVLESLQISMECEFIPWSKSKNFEHGARLSKKTLNWKITIKKDGRDIITTDYSAGIGHCPSYKQKFNFTLDEATALEYEVEHGKRATTPKGSPILPKLSDVLHGLLIESETINYSSFEDWARDFGYDTDSRKAEKIYQECLKTALVLRNGLGDDILKKLREVFEGY